MKCLLKLLFPAWICLLLLSGCYESRTKAVYDSSPNINGVPSLASVYSYQTIDLSAQVLSCSRLYLAASSCDVEDIKPIGAVSSGDVTLEDIKSRLVISHDWMADSFIAALEAIDDQDFLNLFKPLNTIVLSYEIIPSFYHPYTASIYIDARYLWRNTDEWQTIYQQEDYRSDYSSEFLFATVGRYVDGTSSDFVLWSNSYDVDTYNTRTSEQISPALFRLLSHELAHANDFLPSESLTSIGDSGRIYHDYIAQNSHINDELAESIPLTSTLLSDIAQIAYGGYSITEQIKATTASEVGYEFANDGAAHLYSYYTEAEDVAMLFEAFMMYKKYGAVRDIGFVSLPTSDNYGCDDYIVEWGERHRLADSNVKQRAILIGSRILDRDITEDLSEINSTAIAIETGVGWCTSRTQTVSANEEVASRTFKVDAPSIVHDYLDDFLPY